MHLRPGRSRGARRSRSPAPGDPAQDRPSGRAQLREYARSIGFAVGLALLLRAFVVEAYMVPSGSMIPALQVGDHLLANKFVYGLTVPFTTFKLVEGRDPRVGEVVIFTHPRSGETLVKRVVGVGGDILSMEQQVLWRNGQPVARSAVPGDCRYLDEPEPGSDRPCRWQSCQAFSETLGELTHPVYYHSERTWEAFPRTVVPAGHIFVMGDNRDNSGDSRVWGPVPQSHVKGKAMFFWWSRGQQGVRWSRLFQQVR